MPICKDCGKMSKKKNGEKRPKLCSPCWFKTKRIIWKQKTLEGDLK